jgi:hypothetical protein
MTVYCLHIEEIECISFGTDFFKLKNRSSHYRLTFFVLLHFRLVFMCILYQLFYIRPIIMYPYDNNKPSPYLY